MTTTTQRRIAAAVLLAACSLATFPAGAAVKTWDGEGADDLWQTDANWDLNAKPAAGDELVFAGLFRLFPTNDFLADTTFSGLVFAAGADAFALAGNRVTLGGNVTNAATAPQTIGLDLILDATRTFSVATNGTALGTATVSGVISGAGGLLKTGDGTLILTGENSFGGTLTVEDGTVSLRSSAAAGSATKTIQAYGNGTGGLIPGLQLEGGIAVTAATLTVSGAGPLGAGVVHNVSGTNAMVATTIGFASGNGATTLGSSTGRLTVSGPMSAVSSGRQLILLGAGEGEITGAIADGLTTNLPIIKQHVGRWTLSGNNTHGGTNGVTGGSLRITHPNALGAVSNGTGVASGGALELEGGITAAAEPLTINGQGLNNGGALRSVSGDNTWVEPIVLGSASRIMSDAGTLTIDVPSGGAVTSAANQNLSVGGNGNIVVSDPIDIKGGSLTKPTGSGWGTVTLAVDSPFTGNVTLQNTSGVLVVKTSGGLGVGPKTINLAATAFSLQLDGSGGDLTFASNLSWRTSGQSLTLPCLVSLAGNNTLNGDIRLDGGGGSTCIAVSNGLLTLNGTITNINALTRGLILAGSASGIVNGVIVNGDGPTNAVYLQKEGPGVWTLTAMNTYTGATAVNGGTLRLEGGADRLPPVTALTLANVAGGLLDLNGQDQTLASIATGGGNGGNIALGGATLTVTGTADSTYNGVIGGAGNLVKDGVSMLSLGGTNTYGGGTTIRGGTLRLNADDLLPDTTDVILAGGTLAMNSKNDEIRSLTASSTNGGMSGANTSNKVLILNSSGDAIVFTAEKTLTAYLRLSSVSGGAIRVSSAGFSGINGPTLSGRLDLGGIDRTFAIDIVPGGSDLFASMVITNGGVIKTGAGTLKFGTDMQYTGLTDVRQGILFVQDGTNRIPDGNTVQLSGGDWNLATNETIGTLTLVTGTVFGAGAVNANIAFDVRAGASSTRLTGPAGLTKTTAGTVTLSASNSYLGATVISGGTLVVTAPLAGGGPVQVATGATLTGNGAIAGPVTSAGTVAPGNAGVGTLPLQGGYTQAPTGVLQVELAAANHDLLAVTGNASLAGALQVSYSGFAPAAGQSFTVVTASAISGTFPSILGAAPGSGLVWKVTNSLTEVVLLVATQPVYNYATWAGEYGITGTETDDQDSDGYNNLQEYVAGSNPTNPASGARFTGSQVGGVLRGHFMRNTNVTDVDLYVETASSASNSATWTANSVFFFGDWGGDPNVTEIYPGTGTAVNVTVRDITNAVPARFMRLRLDKP